MFHELVEVAHMVPCQMCGLSLLVPPTLGYPDQARIAGVFGKTILQAAIQCLNMRDVQDYAFLVPREILWLDLHKTLNDNHLSGLGGKPLPLGKVDSNLHP
jgi:hypothetical protein